MSFELAPHPTLTRTGPLLLIIADGVGCAPDGPSNAVAVAHTPNIDALVHGSHSVELAAHGTAVGLPSEDDMGNSEVGHNALGAGRIFDQGAKLVNRAIADGSLFASAGWTDLMDAAKGNTLHFLGLHSDGNVHSHTDHLYAMMRAAAHAGANDIAVHVLHDGRDVAARSALSYLEATEAVIDELNEEPGAHVRIASGGGRMHITLDRYEADWEMVERGWMCHTHGEGRRFSSATEAVETMYAESDAGDQYLEAFVVEKDGEPVGQMTDGDVVVLFNFRGDRSIEISQAYENDDENFHGFTRHNRPNVTFAGLLEYDGDAKVPQRYLVDPPTIDRTMSEFLCAEGIRSFAISETQKFGHVTYFWNGNRSGYIDETLETFVEIPSDNVAFNKTPGMKVREITDATIEMLRSGNFDFGRLNFPNGDMVGHTGDLDATVEAMQVQDECVGRLVEVVTELGGTLVYTADHGNADIMYTEKDGQRIPKTSHTLSAVPFAVHDPSREGQYRLRTGDGAGLSNVAATLMNLLGFNAPSDYQPSMVDAPV